MPSSLPATRPTTTPMVSDDETARDRASPSSATPALASAKIGTMT
jgi:hypothetical protein